MFVRFLLFFFCYSSLSAQPLPKRWVFLQPKMGATFSIQVYAADSVRAARAAQEAFAVVDSLNLIFSDYLDTSELSRLSRRAGSGTWQPVSEALFDILYQSQQAWRKSRGAFDVSIGTLTQLWRKTRKERQLPDAQTLQNALKGAGFQHIDLDASQRAVRLRRPNTLLDLGGIGKGYAAQRMLEVMQKYGFAQALCDAAGNMAIGLAPPEREGWQVGIELPSQRGQLLPRQLSLQQGAISTSGDLYQFVEINGVRYSHILNPHTGLGLTNRRQVSIVAPDAAQADWLSTACCILSPRKALRLARHERVEILLLEVRPAGIKAWSSKGWASLMR